MTYIDTFLYTAEKAITQQSTAPCNLVKKHDHASPEAKGSNPTTGLTLLWAHNPFRGNFNHWQVSWKEAAQNFFKRRHRYEKGIMT